MCNKMYFQHLTIMKINANLLNNDIYVHIYSLCIAIIKFYNTLLKIIKCIYVCNSKIYMYIYCLKCKYYKFYAYYITLETAKDMVNYNKSQFMYLYSIV